MTGQHRSADAAGNDDNGLWARSVVLASGGYGVGISFGPRMWTLTRSAAIAYAVACHQEAVRVEHDHAVYMLMRAHGVDAGAAVRLIVDNLRRQRPPLNAMAPLGFKPILGELLGPHCEMFLDGQHIGEVTPRDLRSHGGDVLTVLEVTTLDSALLGALVDAIGMSASKARAAIGTLAAHWPREIVPQPQGV